MTRPSGGPVEPRRPSLAPLEPSRPSISPGEQAPRWSRRHRRLSVASALLLVLLAGLLWWAPWQRAPTRAPLDASDAGVPQGPGADAATALHGARSLEGEVLDDQGTRLAGALLRISSLAAPALPAREVRSDAQGRFRVADLPAESLLIEVTREGHEGKEHTLHAADDGRLTFVLARQGELRVVLRDSPGQAVDATEIVVTGPGLWPAQAARSDDRGEALFKGLPAGEYRVRARHGARIALPAHTVLVVPGRRTETELTLIEGAALQGSVVDRQTRKPLVGAEVSIQDLTPGIDATSVLTDAQGGFIARGLWPGAVRIDGQHAGYAATSRDLTLPHGEPIELALAGAAAISGRVVDEDGKPIAGARISVATDEGLPVEIERDGPAQQNGVGELGVTSGPIPQLPLFQGADFALGTLATETDAAGHFRIARLAPVALALHVARPGYVTERTVVRELIPHQEKSDLQLVLREAGRVVGRVVDARGHALSSVYVAGRSGDREYSAVTDSDGAYTLRDLLGEVEIEAQPDGRTVVRCKATVRARAEARCDLTADSAVHELAVRVVDEYGIGLEAAQVTVRASKPAPNAAPSSTQLTHRDGTAVLRELPAPPYTLDVSLEGQLGVHDLAVHEVEREVRIVLHRSASLGGFVVDSLGRPVPGAFVSTVEGEASGETDAAGTFTLDDVAPGPHSLLAHHGRAGDGRSAEVRARPSERLDGVRIVLKGRFEPDDGDAGKLAGARDERVNKPALTLEQRGRVLVVTQLLQQGPAAKAGMRVGDVIGAIDGEPPLSAAHARGLLRTPAGRTAIVRVLRNKRPVHLQYRRPAL
jgi:protocatechuate 3,4-dioxygenase beta subunit